MVRLLLLSALVALVCPGCDTQPDRPLTLAERVAGTWMVDGVRDGEVVVTRRFAETVGALEVELLSVGCCAGGAGYRFAVTHPDGSVTETVGRYEANDAPTDGDDFIVLVTEDGSFALIFAYDFDAFFSEMTLTGLLEADEMADAFASLGVEFPFRERIVFELDRLD